MAGRQIKGEGGRRHRLLTPHDLAGLIASGGGGSGTNDYNALINKPTLGTAAAKDIGFFATAAQGAKADSAVQPAALSAYVPNTRTVNGKALSADVTLSAADVGAATAAQGAKADAAMPKSGGTFTDQVAITAGNVVNPLRIANAGSQGAAILLSGNGTVTDKTIRSRNGSLGVVNSAFTTEIMTLTDTGNLSVVGTLSAGGLVAGVGFDCGSNVAASASDLSKHINLYNSTYGFSVTSNTLNYISNGIHKFNAAVTAPSVTETSDARLKTNIRRDPNRWRGIRRKVEMVLYDRIDGPNDEPGVIAQEVRKFAPEFVGEMPDGTLTVHYGKLALACALDPEPLT